MDTRAWDVALAGPLFLDYGFADLNASPADGTEVHARTVGVSPGGIANLAVACARLELRTTMAANFGDDVFGDWCWNVLADQERVDLGGSRRSAGAATAVTVAIAERGDRSMITYEPQHPEVPVPAFGEAAAGVVDLRSLARFDGWRAAAATGTRFFADIGWDPSQRWDPADLADLDGCHAFLPNEREAMAYTRADDAVVAARRLAERVPFVFVTRGGDGVIAVDAAAGREVRVPALPAVVVDPTGAGDVFAAALVVADLRGLDVEQRVRFAALASGLAVGRRGSALSAPGWGDIAAWWEGAKRTADGEVVHAYRFVEDIIPAGSHRVLSGAPDRLVFERS